MRANRVKVGFVSLGCPKNVVDTETLLGTLTHHGFEIIAETENADVVIINTCSFITSAKEESIEEILHLAELKKQGVIKKIIVMGCLVQEFGASIAGPLPEVDAFFGIEKEQEIIEYLSKNLSPEEPISSVQWLSRQEQRKLRYRITPVHTAFLKICDGCDNKCSYCIIPSLRGHFRSSPIASVKQEAEALVKKGARELVVIGQDITRYGADLYGEQRLVSFIRSVVKIPDLVWLRLLYLHPAHLQKEIVEIIASEEKVVKYIDLPLQHINDSILKKMNRRVNRSKIEHLLALIRKKIPDVVLRTTFIVGFPGETERQFQELYDFVKEVRFERLGVFRYSPENGTKAQAMPGQITETVKNQRRDALMALQQGISLQANRALIGSTMTVLIERKEKEGLYIGRSWRDAPDVDNNVYLTTKRKLAIGSFVETLIIEAEPYDLTGEVV